MKEIIIHEGYNSAIIIHDIALMRLEKPLNLNNEIKTVQLVDEVRQISGDLHLVGWGLNGVSRKYSTVEIFVI